jgi:hypothetical protein
MPELSDALGKSCVRKDPRRGITRRHGRSERVAGGTRLTEAIAQTPAKQGRLSLQFHRPPQGRAVNQRAFDLAAIAAGRDYGATVAPLQGQQ